MKTDIAGRTALVLLLSVVLVSGCISIDTVINADDDYAGNTNYTAVETFSFQMALDGKSQFKLQGINGNITITGSSTADSVVVSGEKRVGSESAGDAE